MIRDSPKSLRHFCQVENNLRNPFTAWDGQLSLYGRVPYCLALAASAGASAASYSLLIVYFDWMRGCKPSNSSRVISSVWNESLCSILTIFCFAMSLDSFCDEISRLLRAFTYFVRDCSATRWNLLNRRRCWFQLPRFSVHYFASFLVAKNFWKSSEAITSLAPSEPNSGCDPSVPFAFTNSS